MTNMMKYLGVCVCVEDVVARINAKYMEHDPNRCILDIISGKHTDCICSGCEACIKKWMEKEE